jgi:uncharacterized protein (UPF0264 family)
VRLLVSVRSADEVAEAVAGGADIIDAKEPARGSLGPVESAVLRQIAAEMPAILPLSVALGDIGCEEDLAAGCERLTDVPSQYLKLGFAGVRSTAQVEAMVAGAVNLAAHRSDHPRVVIVAYADHDRAEAPAPLALLPLARRAGAAGVLLDTGIKDGRDLFAWFTPAALRDWVGEVRELGLEPAVAGSLRTDNLEAVVEANPAIVGIRGAACEGGRSGRVTRERVSAVRRALAIETVGPKLLTRSGHTSDGGSFGIYLGGPKVT